VEPIERWVVTLPSGVDRRFEKGTDLFFEPNRSRKINLSPCPRLWDGLARYPDAGSAAVAAWRAALYAMLRRQSAERPDA
jgi:hypothetical protein